jgi:ABC-type microcin C transport system permease subunit YejE
LTITVPDAQVQRVLDAFGWAEASGVSRAEFMRSRLIRYVRDVVAQYERDAAARAAAAAVTEPDVT